jgi:hypothetical protein
MTRKSSSKTGFSRRQAEYLIRPLKVARKRALRFGDEQLAAEVHRVERAVCARMKCRTRLDLLTARQKFLLAATSLDKR